MNFRYRLMQFMSGRYGLDRMFYILFAIAALFAVINCFLRLWFIQLVVYAIIIYAFYRVLSRNINARAAENRAVTGFVDKIKRNAEIKKQHRADRMHIYKKCPHCKAVLRLPRRKGKHETVCPKCGNRLSVRVYKEYQ